MFDIVKRILDDERFTDTRIGTESKYEFSNGNTLPLTGVPHGMNYFALQTSGDKGAWWFDSMKEKFEGVRITHQPSPWMGDFSYLTILPKTKDEEVLYDIKNSIFRPSFNYIRYKNGDNLLFSATRQEGILYFESKENVIFDIKAMGLFLKEDNGFISGYVINMAQSEDPNLKMFIHMRLNTDFTLEEIKDGFRVRTNGNNVSLKITTSFISKELATFRDSITTNNICEMIEISSKRWSNYFDLIEVSKESNKGAYEKFERYNPKEEVSFFYHCLYRCFLFPMKFYERDENKKIIHYDTLSKTIKAGRLYTNIGFWDAQKTLFPLLSLIAKDDFENIMEGIVNSYKDSGYLPKWLSPDERGLMPGTLVDNVIADALTKGIGLKYKEELLKGMIKGATFDSNNPRYGRAAVKAYEKLGYVPSNYHESVNQTLDNSLSDFSISVVANLLGMDDIKEKYFEKSKGFRLLFDEETKLLRAKDEEGNFVSDFNPNRWGNPYTEGSSYQNSYNMYHDIEGLIELFGSKEALESRINDMVNSDIDYEVGDYKMVIHEMREYEAAHFGHIAISNQPSFHLPYIYAYLGKPFKTQIIIKELLLNYFKYRTNGYPGDEDNGSMSAWYVLSTMGIYPICPGKGEYIFGISFFDKMKIKLSNGNILEIETKENYHHKKFVISRVVDGENFSSSFITHEKLMNTKKITSTLGIIPIS